MRLSSVKKDKISEQVLAVLYEKSPKPLFTSEIAAEIARDEEFVKNLLFELKIKRLVIDIKKNPKGQEYARRLRWSLSESAYKSYKNHQTSSLQN